MNKIRVLLVDDHAMVREGTREVIQHEPDMEVVGEASDGEEAIALAVKLKPDVILMDIAMPKLNGIEATRRIKAVFPDAVVLAVSAYDNDQYIFPVLEAGAAGYLLKNARGRELVEAIRSVHSGELVLHSAVTRRLVGHVVSNGSGRSEQRAAEPLTEREMEVLKLVGRGMTNQSIAKELVLSPRTIQAHLGRIFSKLQVASRTEAVLYGIKRGWLDPTELP